MTMMTSERETEAPVAGEVRGTAAPLFAMGKNVRGGLHGTSPSLRLAANEDLTFSTDFRQVYATALEKWLDCPSRPVLGGPFTPLDII